MGGMNDWVNLCRAISPRSRTRSRHLQRSQFLLDCTHFTSKGGSTAARSYMLGSIGQTDRCSRRAVDRISSRHSHVQYSPVSLPPLCQWIALLRPPHSSLPEDHMGCVDAEVGVDADPALVATQKNTLDQRSLCPNHAHLQLSRAPLLHLRPTSSNEKRISMQLLPAIQGVK